MIDMPLVPRGDEQVMRYGGPKFMGPDWSALELLMSEAHGGTRGYPEAHHILPLA